MGSHFVHGLGCLEIFFFFVKIYPPSMVNQHIKLTVNGHTLSMIKFIMGLISFLFQSRGVS
jgi:hypothetical protein